MDAKVKEFIEAAKTKEREIFEKERDKHLISLGLVNENESTREYSEYSGSVYNKWDEEKKMYYYERPVPIKVSDEEYEEIKKYSTKKVVEEVELDNGAESFLSVVNVIGLIVGIIATVGLLIAAADSYRGGGVYVLAAAAVLMVSLISWAVVKVVLNMSNNLHKINSKLK